MGNSQETRDVYTRSYQATIFITTANDMPLALLVNIIWRIPVEASVKSCHKPSLSSSFSQVIHLYWAPQESVCWVPLYTPSGVHLRNRKKVFSPGFWTTLCMYMKCSNTNNSDNQVSYPAAQLCFPNRWTKGLQFVLQTQCVDTKYTYFDSCVCLTCCTFSAPSEAPTIIDARALSATEAIVVWRSLTQQTAEGYQVSLMHSKYTVTVQWVMICHSCSFTVVSFRGGGSLEWCVVAGKTMVMY